MSQKVYGIAEIANALGVRADTVSQWHHRGKLPEPTEVLARGAVWLAADIEPWLQEQGVPLIPASGPGYSGVGTDKPPPKKRGGFRGGR